MSRKPPMQRFGLYSIKSKITLFALLATLIPSLTIGWRSYVQNRRFLSQKITQELQKVTSQASREIGLWLKERLYDLKVFSSSYVVTENLARLQSHGASRVEEERALRGLRDYLGSVRAKFTDYEEFTVVTPDGTVVASSAERPGEVAMPDGWLDRARAGEAALGNARWDAAERAGFMVVSQPILGADDRLLGALAAKLNFRGIVDSLASDSGPDISSFYLVTRAGEVVAGSPPLAPGPTNPALPPGLASRLFAQESATSEYPSPRGTEVVGTLKTVPGLSVGVVAEKERRLAYAEIYRLRRTTIWLVGGLLLGIGCVAYLLGLMIVRPLDRLIGGAAKVATGDLDVDLPLSSRGELGYMTEVFNHMVEQLRLGRKELDEANQTLRVRNQELQELSVTDSLTGLFNRKHMWETLARELEGQKRHRRPLAALMIDIDHFKRYNDTQGHLAGDEVLRRLGEIFRSALRVSDYAARYGGEEFLVILPDTDSAMAAQAAERLRELVAGERFGAGPASPKITISIGVASTPEHDEEPEALVRNADTALYRAKKAGRNRAFIFESGSGRPS
jgi:diguanylate cyclase (GGDEF)-like protein